MSASTIADALVTMLSAASSFGTSAVAKDYSVMDSCSASCCIVTWRGMTSKQSTFGPNWERTWTHTLHGFVKDTGDQQALLGRTISFIDNVRAVVEGDPTLQGTVDNVTDITGRRDVSAAVRSKAGLVFLPIMIDVTSVEYSD